MRKLFCMASLLVLLAACTDKKMTRTFGGNTNIEVKKGYKVMEATWKDEGNLWYLIEPMDSGYTPKTKLFIEDSEWGMYEGTVTFKESK